MRFFFRNICTVFFAFLLGSGCGYTKPVLGATPKSETPFSLALEGKYTGTECDEVLPYMSKEGGKIKGVVFAEATERSAVLATICPRWIGLRDTYQRRVVKKWYSSKSVLEFKDSEIDPLLLAVLLTRSGLIWDVSEPNSDGKYRQYKNTLLFDVPKDSLHGLIYLLAEELDLQALESLLLERTGLPREAAVAFVKAVKQARVRLKTVMKTWSEERRKKNLEFFKEQIAKPKNKAQESPSSKEAPSAPNRLVEPQK